MILRVIDFEFSVNVFPNMFHVLSILNDTIFHRVLEFEQTFMLVNIISNVKILSISSHHDFCMLRFSNEIMHLNLWLLSASKTCFNDTASIVNNNRLCLSK